MVGHRVSRDPVQPRSEAGLVHDAPGPYRALERVLHQLLRRGGVPDEAADVAQERRRVAGIGPLPVDSVRPSIRGLDRGLRSCSRYLQRMAARNGHCLVADGAGLAVTMRTVRGIAHAATKRMKMRPMVLALVATLALAFPAAATGQATRAVEVCGTLRAYSAPTPSAPGSVQIGTQTYEIAPATTVGNGGVQIGVGRDLCATGSLAAAGAQLVRLTFFAMLTGDRVCGNIVPSSSNVVLRADFGELTLVPASGVTGDNDNMRVCYGFSVDRQSGALTATQKIAARTNVVTDLERATKCGRVNTYAPATSATSGQLTIGSRSFRIAAGTTYTGDPAGDRTDRTKVGEGMCLSATLDPGGAIVQYLTRPIDTNIAATAVQYTPPSGPGEVGIAILSYQSRFELVIPASLDATLDLARGSYCFTTSVNAAGDLTAYAVRDCSPGGAAAGASATPTAIPSASAAPSATSTPAAAPSPKATALAVSSPTPSATGTGGPPAVPIAVLGVIVAAAAIAGSLVLRRVR